jgi:hypothetical protein
MPLQIRRGTEAERQILATPPQQGELVYITDSEQLYIGDGTSLLRNITPVTGYTDENALDYIGSVLDAGPHTGISFAHSDAGNSISATISPTQSLTTLTVSGNTSLGTTTVNGNLAVTGKLTADFNGSISGDDSTTLVDGVDNKINLDGTVKGNIIPNLTETYDIGSSSLKFKDLYLSGTSLHLGDAEVTATGAAINLPVGSTVGGVSIMSGSESVVSDIQGSVFGDDSSIIVNAIDNTITVGTGLNIGQTIDSGMTLFDTSSNAEGGVYIYPGTDADSPLVLATLTSTPSSVADVLTGLGNLRRMTLESYKGSIASPTQLVGGDILGAYAFSGQDSPTNDNRIVSAILSQVDPNGTITTDRVDQKIHILVGHGVNGASTKKFTFDSAGQMAINQETAAATLDVNGFAKLAILTAAPAVPAQGMIAIADGTVWNPTGSGNQTVVAYVNGAWAALS